MGKGQSIDLCQTPTGTKVKAVGGRVCGNRETQPLQKAKANEHRGRTEPASPGLVTAKSGRTMASGASTDYRVTLTETAKSV